MGKKKRCQPCELRIRGIGEESMKVIKAIAAHQGETANKVVASKLTEIVESFPEHIRKQHHCEPCSELKLVNLKPTVKEEIKNIAQYYGMDISSFLKSLIRDITKKFPAHLNRELST